MTSYFKTGILLAGMTAFFMAVGYAMGGVGGMAIAFVIALGMNAFSYWRSDTAVLKRYKAQPIDRRTASELDAVMERLSHHADIPRPKTYIIANPQPNAFATGRNPSHAAVAVTTGLLDHLTMDEVAAVVAHELAHIKNRDTLIMTVSATISGAIGMLTRFSRMLGGRRGQGRGNPIAMIAMMILAPLAAMVVQMMISRTREYEADRMGAEICGKPDDLADALEKISGIAPRVRNQTAESHPETAHLFIFNPIFGGMRRLFSTHPDPAERIRRLRNMTISADEPVYADMSRGYQADQISKKVGPWG